MPGRSAGYATGPTFEHCFQQDTLILSNLANFTISAFLIRLHP
jgi:hypothetical protein